MPTMQWREVTQAAIYLYNRTPRYTNKWKSPYESLFNRKPGQEHLRAYGCKAFAMTTAAKRKKDRLQRLDPKAWIRYLMGYTSSNIYRIWVPLLNKVIFTRDVIFNKDEVFNGNLNHLYNTV